MITIPNDLAGGSLAKIRKLCDISALILTVWLAGDALLRTGFSSQLWLLMYGFVLFMIMADLKNFISTFAGNQSLFLVGYLALFSASWSLLPNVSFISGMQLLMTIMIGVYLGSRLSLREIIWIYALAAGMSIVISAMNLSGIFGHNYSDVGGFLGIYTNKNLFAQQVGLFLLCAIPIVIDHGRLRVIVILSMIIASYFLWVTKSVATLGAVLIFFSASLVAIAMTASSLSRFLITAFGLIMGACIILIWLNFDVGFWQILDAFGKDKTLTGRIDIWQVGISHFKQEPWVGIGYASYWRNPEFASEIALLQDQFGENVSAFHNFAIEGLVSFGIVGILPIAVFCIVPIVRLARLARYPSSKPILTSCFAILGFGLFIALFGPVLMRQHETTMFLFPAIAIAAQIELHRQKEGRK